MIILCIHAASTLFMMGLIWVIQVIHYPLFASVGPENFAAYHASHMRLTTWVVGPPMLLELGATALLLIARPAGIPAWLVWLGAGLLAVVWASTALLQVPAHTVLSQGLDPDVVKRLVNGNWIRTAGWTARAGVALWMLANVSSSNTI